MSLKKTAIIAFVPVIHKGYLVFFRNHLGDIYVFGPELISSFVHLTRDLRCLDPQDIVKTLKVILPDRKAGLVSKEMLLGWDYDLTIMPDDEVSREIATKYLPNKKVDFVPVFLRWNKVITFKENEIQPNRKITKEILHQNIISKAAIVAQKSADWWRQIGAIVVNNGKIIYETYNHPLPTDFHLSVNGDPRSNFNAGENQNIFLTIHAEAEAIAKAAKDGVSLAGASLYTTTFPCPNCARLLGTAGIKKVYYSKGYSLFDAEVILEHFGVEIILVQD